MTALGERSWYGIFGALPSIAYCEVLILMHEGRDVAPCWVRRFGVGARGLVVVGGVPLVRHGAEACMGVHCEAETSGPSVVRSFGRPFWTEADVPLPENQAVRWEVGAQGSGAPPHPESPIFAVVH